MSSVTSLLVVAVLVCPACTSGSDSSPPSSPPVAPPVASSERAKSDAAEPTVSAPNNGSGSDGEAELAPVCVAPTGPAVVRMWEVFGGDKATETFASLVDEFNTSHPDVQLQTEHVDGSPALFDRLAATSPGDWPDIIVSQPQSLRRLVDTGVIIPPGECSEVGAMADDLLPVVEATYSFDDVLQAIPFGVSTAVLVYDATELGAAGLDPLASPMTLDEMFDASRTVVDAGASPNGLVVYDWFGTYLINQGAAQRGQLVASAENGRVAGPVRVQYDTPQNVAAMAALQGSVRDQASVWIGGIPSGFDDLARLVDPTDGGAMTIHTTGALGDVIRLLEAGSFPDVELGVAPLPGPASGGLVGGNGFWLVDHGDPQQAGAAFIAAEWLAQPGQLSRLDTATGYIPPSFSVAAEPAVVDAWADHPQLRVGFDQLAAQPGNNASAGAVYGPSFEIDELFYGFTKSIVSDGVPVEQALQSLTTQVNTLLEEYETTVEND